MSRSRSGFQWVSAAVLAAAVVPGCGGSSSSSQPEDFSRRLAKLICDRLVGCCSALSQPLDPVTCNANATSYFQAELSAPDPAKVHYNASGADDCLAAYSGALNGCTFDQSKWQALDAACDRVFVGLVPPGGACLKGAECAPQPGGRVSCDFGDSSSGSSDVGTCMVDPASPVSAPHGKQGEACAGSCTGISCSVITPTGPADGTTALCFTSDELYCDRQNVCQPTLADGAACTYSECQGASHCSNGVCAPKQANGTVCSSSDQCLAGRCVRAKDNDSSQSGVCGEDSIANADTCAGKFDD